MKRLLLALALGGLLPLAACESDSERPIDRPSSEQTWSDRGWSTVGAYQRVYEHLPDLGDTADYMGGRSADSEQVDMGYMEGDLRLGGNGKVLNGAGVGQTVIDGDLKLNGSGWTLSGMTITGDAEVTGQNNDLSGLEILGDVNVRGENNKFPLGSQ